MIDMENILLTMATGDRKKTMNTKRWRGSLGGGSISRKRNSGRQRGVYIMSENNASKKLRSLLGPNAKKSQSYI